jgi:hypothetical protein
MIDAAKRSLLILLVGTALVLGAGYIADHGIIAEKPPFETEDLKALVVIDEGQRQRMTSKQIAAFEGADIRDWTDKKAKAFIVLDKDTKPSDMETKWLQEAWKSYAEKSKGVLPWVVIANSHTGTSEAYPDNPPGAIALLERFEK